MWPFRRKPASPELIERIETLERGLRNLRIDWDDTYEKLTRILGRITKRDALARARGAETPEDAPESTNGAPPVLDPFSEQVMQLRGHRRHA